jgi:hypothetical protein
VLLDGGPHAHLMLTVLAIECIIHEVLVDQNFGVLNVDVSDVLILFLD